MLPFDTQHQAMLDQALEKLAQAWKIAPEPDLAQFLPWGPSEPGYKEMLAQLIDADQEHRNKAGCPKPLEAYLSEFHILPDEDDLLDTSTQSFYAPPPVDETLGSTVGPYKLRSVLGEGGFGTVYLADQEKPIRRRVALKIIKAGMDTRQVLARFEAERQALAMMDHPNIAKVFDAGSTETGRSYFVMELVHGEPITDYCDRHKLTLEERLELFIPVCQAVQHAHQKGIIHRDLKPKNVLVAVVDDKPAPKVIDFGVAKAMAQPLTEQSIFTEQGQLIGTPEYMSPEQAEMSNLDIDTRSDIYSLGVLFYELLTGALPFDRHSLRQAGLDEIRRIIREVEPPKPSTKISSLGDDSNENAGKRRSDPHSLRRRLMRELDWIVMKTLEKDRTRRYATATSLAEDVQRFLQHEPVEAGPPGNLYRIRKYSRRYRMPLSIASGFAILLMAITLLAIRGYYSEADLRTNEEVARKQADEERLRAETEKEKAQAAQLRSEESLTKAEENLYANRIALAHQKWLSNECAEAEQQLEECPIQFRCWEWNYLKRLCHLDLLTLRNHTGYVHSVAFSSDGKRVASGSEDRTVLIWDVESREVLSTLRGHFAGVYSVAFSPDGKLVASGSLDKTVKIWDAGSGQERRASMRHSTGISSESYSQDGNPSASINMRELLPLNGHSAGVSSVAFSPDGKRVASGSKDCTVLIWDVESREILQFLNGHSSDVSSVSFSPDGNRVASGSKDKMVKIWDAGSGQELLTLHGHSDGINSVAFSPDGKRLASGSEDETVKIWDSVSVKEPLTLHGYTGYVCSVAFSPDGKYLVSGTWDKTVKIWDAANGQELLTLRGHSSIVNSVAFSADGKRLVSASKDKTVKIWDTVYGQDILPLHGHTGFVQSVVFSIEGKRLASASKDKSVKIWDAVSGQELLTLPGHSSEVNSVAFSPDGQRLASASKDKSLKIWDAVSGQELLTFRGHSGEVNSVAFSQDGKRLASGSSDCSVRIWDAVSGQELLTLCRHSDGTLCEFAVYSVAFSPDGKRVASGSHDNIVRIWDVASGQELRTLPGHSDNVESVAFSPDGKRLASGSLDRTVKIWNAMNGQDLLTFRGHSGEVNSVAFSPDSKRLASGSWDRTVKIWDAGSGQELLTLRGHSNKVSSVIFSPDGKRLASGSDDQTVLIWDAASVQEMQYKYPDEKRKEN